MAMETSTKSSRKKKNGPILSFSHDSSAISLVTHYKKKITDLVMNNKALEQALETSHRTIYHQNKVISNLEKKLVNEVPEIIALKFQAIGTAVKHVVDLVEEATALLKRNTASNSTQKNNSNSQFAPLEDRNMSKEPRTHHKKKKHRRKKSSHLNIDHQDLDNSLSSDSSEMSNLSEDLSNKAISSAPSKQPSSSSIKQAFSSVRENGNLLANASSDFDSDEIDEIIAQFEADKTVRHKRKKCKKSSSSKKDESESSYESESDLPLAKKSRNHQEPETHFQTSPLMASKRSRVLNDHSAFPVTNVSIKGKSKSRRKLSPKMKILMPEAPKSTQLPLKDFLIDNNFEMKPNPAVATKVVARKASRRSKSSHFQLLQNFDSQMKQNSQTTAKPHVTEKKILPLKIKINAPTKAASATNTVKKKATNNSRPSSRCTARKLLPKPSPPANAKTHEESSNVQEFGKKVLMNYETELTQNESPSNRELRKRLHLNYQAIMTEKESLANRTLRNKPHVSYDDPDFIFDEDIDLSLRIKTEPVENSINRLQICDIQSTLPMLQPKVVVHDIFLGSDKNCDPIILKSRLEHLAREKIQGEIRNPSSVEAHDVQRMTMIDEVTVEKNNYELPLGVDNGNAVLFDKTIIHSSVEAIEEHDVPHTTVIDKVTIENDYIKLPFGEDNGNAVLFDETSNHSSVEAIEEHDAPRTTVIDEVTIENDDELPLGEVNSNAVLFDETSNHSSVEAIAEHAAPRATVIDEVTIENEDNEQPLGKDKSSVNNNSEKIPLGVNNNSEKFPLGVNNNNVVSVDNTNKFAVTLDETNYTVILSEDCQKKASLIQNEDEPSTSIPVDSLNENTSDSYSRCNGSAVESWKPSSNVVTSDEDSKSSNEDEIIRAFVKQDVKHCNASIKFLSVLMASITTMWMESNSELKLLKKLPLKEIKEDKDWKPDELDSSKDSLGLVTSVKDLSGTCVPEQAESDSDDDDDWREVYEAIKQL